MRITVKRDPEKPSGSKRVFMDGVLQDAWAFGRGPDTVFWVWSGPFLERLLQTPVVRFPKRLLSSEINLLFRKPLGCPYATWAELRQGAKELHVRFGFNSNEWKGDWSISEYVKTFHDVVGERGIDHLRVKTHDPKSPSIELTFAVVDPAKPLQVAIDALVTTVHEVHNETQRRLDTGSIAIRFAFPDAVRHVCVQYLVYFAEFLHDMGVEVAARITDGPGEVLFSVTPSDPEQALSAIREALNLYLALPGSPILDIRSNDMVAQKLIANVRHLEGQLALARAVAHAQSATIDALEVTLGYERNASSGGILADSVMAVDREEVLGGTVAITRYEGKGFEINLAKVLRKIRAIFRK